MDKASLLNEMPVTCLSAWLTVTMQFATTYPPPEEAVIVAVPLETAVTFPSWSTVATLLLLDFHATASVESEGVRVAMSWIDPPSYKAADVRLSLMPVAGIVSEMTLTLQVAVLDPSWVVTVMVALPVPTAFTVPLLTVATPMLLLVQVTILSVASAGLTVAVSERLSPLLRLTELLSMSTPVTGTPVEGAL